LFTGAQTPVNKITSYGDDRSNPWLNTWDGLHEVQTENGNAVIKVPLEELGEMSSPRNAVDVVTNDVYLYFSMAQRIERYHNQTLEDVGPNKDLGLPDYRSGDVVAMTSTPGGVLAAVGGNIPSILLRKTGWHEVYRAPSLIKIVSGYPNYNALPIYDMAAQPIPSGPTLLWIAQGTDICRICLSLDANNSVSSMHESSVITSWITMGFLDVPKTFRRLKLYTEGLAGSGSGSRTERIRVYYQLETETADWTLLSYNSNGIDNDNYIISPFETKLFPAGISARRIRLKFVINSQQRSSKIVVRSWVLDALLVLPVYHVYTLPVLLSDTWPDMMTQPDPTIRAETILSRLDNYASSPPEILTMNTVYSTSDSKSVIIQPIPDRPKEITISPDGKPFEAHIIEVTLIEV
jgi:hypothetical protein